MAAKSPDPRSPYWEEENISPNTPALFPPLPSKRNFIPEFLQEFPAFMCKCRRRCIVRESQSKNSLGRYYYQCPKLQIGERCKIFQWCDEVGKIQSHCAKNQVKLLKQRDAAEASYPICKCTAGPCRLETMHSEPFKGCRYFACHLKTGQGACDHFEFFDSPVDTYETKEYRVADDANLNANLASAHEDDHVRVFPAPSLLGVTNDSSYSPPKSAFVERPHSPEESPSKRKCIAEEWMDEYAVSPTLNVYVTTNEPGICCNEYACIESEETIPAASVESDEASDLQSPAMTRNANKLWLQYSPMRTLDLSGGSLIKTENCLVCGEEHETRECL